MTSESTEIRDIPEPIVRHHNQRLSRHSLQVDLPVLPFLHAYHPLLVVHDRILVFNNCLVLSVNNRDANAINAGVVSYAAEGFAEKHIYIYVNIERNNA